MTSAREDVPTTDELLEEAETTLRALRSARLTIATAESCTGGQVASLLTDVPGLSGLFERGFVTYSVEAKCELLGLVPGAIEREGVVSRATAVAMAKGALAHSRADIAVSLTGYAGPGGEGEPGLVHVAAMRRGRRCVAREFHFGDIGRDEVRRKVSREALRMVRRLVRRDQAASG